MLKPGSYCLFPMTLALASVGGCSPAGVPDQSGPSPAVHEAAATSARGSSSGSASSTASDPWVNPNARGDAFKLLYKERLSRIALSYNRFSLVNDVVPAQTINTTFVSHAGNDWDVLIHPTDNNPPGSSTFNAFQAYKAFRSRDLALTTIRQFEGLMVREEISGHPGLTCREWAPGWTLSIDGTTGAVHRTHNGAEMKPAEVYGSSLEQEIVSTFFAGGSWKYHADPTEFYFASEPVLSSGTYAATYVFQHMPDYLFVSDCCSSFMVSKLGSYSGYFWGNHDSRDNFPDLAMGYFASLEASLDTSSDPDVRASASRSWEAGQRVGDHVVDNGYTLMTVSEFLPYDQEMPSGDIRPYGAAEPPGNLGDMDSCQMSYMAKALSSYGLFSPREVVELPGAYRTTYVDYLFELLGLPQPPITKRCFYLDQAYGPYSWNDLLTMQIKGKSLLDILEERLYQTPDLVEPIIEDIADSVWQPQKAATALVYYALLTQGQSGELTVAARETLFHILEIKRRCSQMLIDWTSAQPVPDQGLLYRANGWLYDASRDAHTFGVGNAQFTMNGFAEGQNQNQRFENVLALPDTPAWAMKSNDQIWAEIQNEISGAEPEVVDRFDAAYPSEADQPVHVKNGKYEAVGLDGAFHPISNLSHQWFGAISLVAEAPLCTMAPSVLDCSWARLGCGRPDLDGSRTVDAADQALFTAAGSSYGTGGTAKCSASNGWCGGADLDRNGTIDPDDQAFMTAAQGCWY